MDVIKKEPEFDPLAIQSCNDADAEESNTLLDDGILPNSPLAQISEGYNYASTSEVKTEDTPLPITFAEVKYEPQEQAFDVSMIKEECKLEVTKEEYEPSSDNTLNTGEQEMRLVKLTRPENSVTAENPVVKSQQMCFRKRGADRRFKCNVCGKYLSQYGHLKRHMRTHTGVKPFKCDVCGKWFSLLGTLQSHIRTHTGEKPYTCDTCGKSFSQSGVLADHSRTHTDEKDFKCDICGKYFSRSRYLLIHARTHIAKTPLKCEECGKCFSHSGALKSHRRTHCTDAEALTSNTSGKSFSQYSRTSINCQSRDCSLDG